MAERVEQIEKGSESRVAIVGEVKKKRKSSAMKKSKRKYRLLEATKSGVAGVDENDQGVDNVVSASSAATLIAEEGVVEPGDIVKKS